MNRILAVTLALVAVTWATPSHGIGETHGIETITGEGVRRHMTVLADDAMQGRETGTPGFDRAADYVASRFAAATLRPLGDEGSFFQGIEFLESRLVEESPRLVFHAKSDHPMGFKKDFACHGGFAALHEEVTQALVFVGYGIVAPEYGHDDYVGIDARGKILVVLTNAPSSFATDQRAYYSSSNVKKTFAAERGALGILFVRTLEDQERYSWERLIDGVGSSAMCWIDQNGEPYEGFPMLVTATLNESGARTLFELGGGDFDSILASHARGETGSFEMPVTATLGFESRHRRARSANVIALLPGADPVLRDEYVLFTAHLDHLGIRTEKNDDPIYNGAYDNAAGVATVLEVARAMAAMQSPPRRSVIFAALTGEEKGLRGSSYLASHLPIPVTQLVANINIDMPYLGFPVNDIEAFGAEHSTLHAAMEETMKRMDMSLTPDPMPERVRFIRSDQFSFVRHGIPALAFKAGSTSSDPTVDGHAMLLEFLKNDYHQPSDDLSLPFNAEGAERFARAAFTLGILVANQDERPHWNEGDFFAEKFAGQEAVRR